MEQKDQIKEAFSRIRQDIYELKSQMSFMQLELESLKSSLEQEKAEKIIQEMQKSQENREIKEYVPQIRHNSIQKQAFIHENPSNTETPADKWALEAVKSSFIQHSTGNEGVPADRQTNQQTDQQPFESSFKTQDIHKNTKKNEIEKVSELLDSLDGIKNDLKSKFKHLTKQEMLIFSTIYQLEEEDFVVDYPRLALKLGLTESSIRDYVQKLIKKGIPIQKSKENNKKITLSISSDLKKIASLHTILALKEL